MNARTDLPADLAHNPLLDFAGPPCFDRIRPEHVEPALTHLLAQASAALEVATAPTFAAHWTALSRTLDVPTEHLGRAWGAISHLNSVADSPELRAAYNAALPKVTEFWTRLGADERLYAQYKLMDKATLNAEQQQAHTNAMRGFVLGGADLQGADKTRYAQIQERLAELSQKFSENALDATDGFAYYATAAELEGVPADAQAAMHRAAQDDGQEGLKVTLKLPDYLPCMQFARQRALRERLYRAYCTRASDQAPAEFQHLDNTAIVQELLALRHEEAQLLGFAHFAELSLVPKMATSSDQVVSFLQELATKARPYALQDVQDMHDFAAQHLGLPDPQAWDLTYVAEQLRQARYAYSEQDVKPYFTAPKVLEGLFHIVQTLFEVRIVPDTAPVWHPTVQYFRIERASTTNTTTDDAPQIVGHFYLDPAARNGKRGGAWMDDVRARWLRPDNGQLQTPIAHMVCNFAQGHDGTPALLTHDDVITLFHEFGHGLHHMLTQVNERDVSGISGVEWDAVELPSQFMENFCWEWDVLKRMTAHVDTGEPLPRQLFDKMLAAKNFQSGLQTLRQIEFSLFDMLMHGQPTPVHDFVGLLQRVRDDVAVLQPPAFNRMAHSFSHIFAGGYAAGYYSYKWAEVLSADAYAAFEEAAHTTGTTLDPATGRRYRQAILEAGGSRPAMESFKAFRGREPQMDALLRHQGMH